METNTKERDRAIVALTPKIEKWIKRAYPRIARSRLSRSLNFSDLVQEAYVGLLKHYEEWEKLDHDKRPWEAYAHGIVTRYAWMYIEKSFTPLKTGRRRDINRKGSFVTVAAYNDALRYLTFSELDELRATLDQSCESSYYDPADLHDDFAEIDRVELEQICTQKLKENLSPEEYRFLWAFCVDVKAAKQIAEEENLSIDVIERRLHKILIKATGLLHEYEDV